ncbi:hypothetical protein XELAEV_18041557mg [Xenopus laevis]|uniref:Uncharacterized protein n=1 Tax=Xenopus laevis TaxID=8355 RepID=A0A974C2F5_XENLA|nr:hypothetical protein XELAEV_18041557mg [Xenopus laevis]
MVYIGKIPHERTCSGRIFKTFSCSYNISLCQDASTKSVSYGVHQTLACTSDSVDLAFLFSSCSFYIFILCNVIQAILS